MGDNFNVPEDHGVHRTAFPLSHSSDAELMTKEEFNHLQVIKLRAVRVNFENWYPRQSEIGGVRYKATSCFLSRDAYACCMQHLVPTVQWLSGL
jgi:hypothetical protein